MRLLLDHQGNGNYNYNNDYNAWDNHNHSYYHTDGALNTWVIVVLFVLFFFLLLLPFGLCCWPEEPTYDSQKKKTRRIIREVDYITTP